MANTKTKKVVVVNNNNPKCYGKYVFSGAPKCRCCPEHVGCKKKSKK